MLAADVLEVVAVAALVSALGSNIGVPMISLGHYRFNAAIQAIGAAALLPMLLVGTLWLGAMGAAWATLGGNVVTVFVALLLAKRAFGFGPFDFVLCVWRPLLAAVVMALAVRLTQTVLAGALALPTPWLLLPPMIAAGAIAYLSMLWLLWALSGRAEGGETRAARLLNALWRRLGRRADVPA
jgi:O-antigen/teichoic acid export membrane protein